MRILFAFCLSAIVVVISSCENPDNLVLVKGGAFKNIKSKHFEKEVVLPDFYIGKYEVTQKEWVEIMGSNPSTFKGDDLPVEMVTWYDCVEYCNKRSIKEGLTPYYNIDKEKKDVSNWNDIDSLKWTVTTNKNANGYRLPTELEWEYAASGGQKSRSYTYSGSYDVNEAGWYWMNSGDSTLSGLWHWVTVKNNNCKTHPVGLKRANELGLYDMSGNVREWCEDWFEDEHIRKGFVRVQRGGGWLGGEHRCESFNRHHFDPTGQGQDQGFRVCRNI